MPAKLLSKLKLKHKIINNPDHFNDEFKKIFKRNVSTAHDIYNAYAQGIYDQYPLTRVCMKGDVSEVAKCYYRMAESNGREITGQKLTLLSEGMPVHSFATNAFDKWLSNLNSYNIHVLDLFCWEQDIGRCVAMIQAECDIVMEAFTPFNCRGLLIKMLSVHEEFRRPPEYQLFKALINNLWTEVLSEPINPPEKKSMEAVVIDILEKTNLYQFIPKPMKRIGKKVFCLFQ